jgi:hypothetical protein
VGKSRTAESIGGVSSGEDYPLVSFAWVFAGIPQREKYVEVVGYAPFDESVYGVRDMTGSVSEHALGRPLARYSLLFDARRKLGQRGRVLQPRGHTERPAALELRAGDGLSPRRGAARGRKIDGPRANLCWCQRELRLTISLQGQAL